MKKVLFLSLLVTSSLVACLSSNKPYPVYVNTGNNTKKKVTIDPQSDCVIITNDEKHIVLEMQDTRNNIKLALEECLKLPHDTETIAKLTAALSTIQTAKKTHIINMNGFITTHALNIASIKRHKTQLVC